MATPATIGRWCCSLDGEETNPGTRNFDTAVHDLVDATGKKPVIHTVAVGPDADRPRMQAAASRTGGTYQYVSAPAGPLNTPYIEKEMREKGRSLDLRDSITAPADLADMSLSMDYRYRNIATEIIGQQQFLGSLGLKRIICLTTIQLLSLSRVAQQKSCSR